MHTNVFEATCGETAESMLIHMFGQTRIVQSLTIGRRKEIAIRSSEEKAIKIFFNFGQVRNHKVKFLNQVLIAILLVVGFSDISFPITPTINYSEDQEFTYVASRKSNKYHLPNCSAAQRIKAENLIGFTSREDVLRTGYVPCKICRP